ncbi:MAG TPA: ABC transporter substrate-binding protein [Steroidobacteraceae bacterium]|nr:ABC transporter substrate-binding protein [Steroidobacteraceae bacterium]
MIATLSRRRFCALFLCAALTDAPASDLVAGMAARTTIKIGVLSTGPIDPEGYRLLAARLKADLAGIIGQLILTPLEAGSSIERLADQTDRILSLQPDVILCLDLTAAQSASRRRTGQNPPIVFMVHADPLAYHLIQGYAHPGNNMTGVTSYRCVDEKMVELLADAFPKRRHIGYFVDASVDDSSCIRLVEEAAARLHLRVVQINVASADFLASLRPKLHSLQLDAIIAPALAPLWQNRNVVVATLNDLRLPAIYESHVFLDVGGLMSYGPIRTDEISQAVNDVRKILSGEVAGEIPVEQPTLFELVVNLRAPHAHDYGISAPVLRRADRILE